MSWQDSYIFTVSLKSLVKNIMFLKFYFDLNYCIIMTEVCNILLEYLIDFLTVLTTGTQKEIYNIFAFFRELYDSVYDFEQTFY